MKTIKELHDEAVDVAQEHWNWHLRENALREPKEKGRLNVQVRLHKDRVLEICWQSFRFHKPEGSTKSAVKSTRIKKGRDYKYRAASLSSRAKSWEIEPVLEFEERLAKIRSEYAEVSKAIATIDRAKKKRRVRQAENEGVSHED